MTVGKLKELLCDIPDHLEVYLHDSYGNDPQLQLVGVNWIDKRAGKTNKVVELQTRSDFDVQEELSARIKWASETMEDEDSFYWDIYQEGFVPDDFIGTDYYEAVKEYMEEHGLA